MVDSHNGSDRKQDQTGSADVLLRFAAALRDMFVLGSAAVENVLSENNLASSSEALGPALDPMLRATAALRDLAEVGIRAFGTDRSLYDAGQPAGVASIAAQTYLIAAVSGFRYLRRVAETYGVHQSSILQSLLGRLEVSGASDEERRVLIDEIRTYLRELGDVSLQEARIFQLELEKLATEVASDRDDATSEPPKHRRRWKAKQ
jgi:hypothetical protein